MTTPPGEIGAIALGEAVARIEQDLTLRAEFPLVHDAQHTSDLRLILSALTSQRTEVIEACARVAEEIVLVGKPGSLPEAVGRSDMRNAIADAIRGME